MTPVRTLLVATSSLLVVLGCAGPSQSAPKSDPVVDALAPNPSVDPITPDLTVDAIAPDSPIPEFSWAPPSTVPIPFDEVLQYCADFRADGVLNSGGSWELSREKLTWHPTQSETPVLVQLRFLALTSSGPEALVFLPEDDTHGNMHCDEGVWVGPETWHWVEVVDAGSGEEAVQSVWETLNAEMPNWNAAYIGEPAKHHREGRIEVLHAAANTSAAEMVAAILGEAGLETVQLRSWEQCPAPVMVAVGAL